MTPYAIFRLLVIHFIFSHIIYFFSLVPLFYDYSNAVFCRSTQLCIYVTWNQFSRLLDD